MFSIFSLTSILYILKLTWIYFTKCIVDMPPILSQIITLISSYISRFILTAGHCVHYCYEGPLPNCTNHIPFSHLTFKVVLGEYDVKSEYKEKYIERYHATNIYVHPEFSNAFTLRDDGFLESEPRHDVALLKLDRKVIHV